MSYSTVLTIVENSLITREEGTKSILGIMNFNLRKSQFRKRGKIGLNQSLTYISTTLPLQRSSQKKSRKYWGLEAFVPLAALSVFNLVVYMLSSRYIVLLLLYHTPLAAPRFFNLIVFM